jgi:hypothetical protein
MSTFFQPLPTLPPEEPQNNVAAVESRVGPTYLQADFLHFGRIQRPSISQIETGWWHHARLDQLVKSGPADIAETSQLGHGTGSFRTDVGRSLSAHKTPVVIVKTITGEFGQRSCCGDVGRREVSWRPSSHREMNCSRTRNDSITLETVRAGSPRRSAITLRRTGLSDGRLQAYQMARWRTAGKRLNPRR